MIDHYEAFMEFIHKKREYKPKLLLHACCAPCASSILELLKDVFDITIHFYNPNIYPYEEYVKRLNEFKKFANIPVIESAYEDKAYYEAVAGLESLGERSKRCFSCYNLRLKKTAQLAKEHNFDYFTTTLSLSPYKDSNKINEIGQNLAKEYEVAFLYSNFKKNNGYKRSIELSKELGLYRQNYCGCLFSFEERKKSTI